MIRPFFAGLAAGFGLGASRRESVCGFRFGPGPSGDRERAARSHVRSPAPESVCKGHQAIESPDSISERSVSLRLPASCAVGLLLTVLGYFAVVLARGAANSAFGRPCRNFQELGVSPDQRRKACVKALNSEKPSALATSETEASVSRSR